MANGLRGLVIKHRSNMMQLDLFPTLQAMLHTANLPAVVVALLSLASKMISVTFCRLVWGQRMQFPGCCRRCPNFRVDTLFINHQGDVMLQLIQADCLIASSQPVLCFQPCSLLQTARPLWCAMVTPAGSTFVGSQASVSWIGKQV